jgi:hypothetical protein
MAEKSPHEESDPFEQELGGAGPRVSTITPSIEDELARMAVSARTDTARNGARRRVPRVAVIGLAAVLAISGAGAAAAATGGFTSWWADEADAVYTFTLPSGAVCEARWGNVMGDFSADGAREAARNYLRSVDGVDQADIDAQIARMRADRDTWFQNADGTREPAWYGTAKYMSPDSEYEHALSSVVTNALWDELERQGFDAEEDLRNVSVSGEVNCPGAQW